MAIAPFRPAPLEGADERHRARLALVAATVGIAAALLAYAISPGVRHAVSHAERSVRHAVSRVFDQDARSRATTTTGITGTTTSKGIVRYGTSARR
ncbi:MAG: hypothetical protein FWD42_09400 [Solirubrobacterales bacterium]|nr:hypothetical protein [Solirubrobacterales bacterium]